MLFTTADDFERHTIPTGNPTLDRLLDGGLELGLLHLFYGSSILNRDLLRMAVYAQLPPERGGLGSPCIIIDSNNILRIEQVTQYAFEAGLEPEAVMDNIFITRAFNSSQTYTLVMEELEGFFDRVHARLLLVPGLADIYHREGLTVEGMRELAGMANRLMVFSMFRGIATVVSAMPSERAKQTAVGGRALNSCAQVHVNVEESRSRVFYRVVKHPAFGYRERSRMREVPEFGVTLPLEYFIPELREDGL